LISRYLSVVGVVLPYSNKNTVGNNGMNTFLEEEGFFFGFIVTPTTTYVLQIRKGTFSY
jgi:hypothetical protein